jgi:hypothetical protein
MPDEKKFDPFKPQQPSIPGVLPASANPKPEETPPELPGPPPEKSPLLIPMLAAAGLGAIIIIWGLIHLSRGFSPKSMPASADSGGAPAVAPVGDANPKGTLPVGPGPVATADELAQPWSSKRFLFRNYVSGQAEPALVVRLPRGDYWGFSLIEPFGNCELEFITNLDKLRAEYHFHADHPMVGDPCNRTVYDLLRYGAGASSEEVVRGMIVQGNGIRPPMAIEIKTNGKEIVAVREE